MESRACHQIHGKNSCAGRTATITRQLHKAKVQGIFLSSSVIINAFCALLTACIFLQPKDVETCLIECYRLWSFFPFKFHPETSVME